MNLPIERRKIRTCVQREGFMEEKKEVARGVST